jgi:hypothetical protein
VVRVIAALDPWGMFATGCIVGGLVVFIAFVRGWL